MESRAGIKQLTHPYSLPPPSHHRRGEAVPLSTYPRLLILTLRVPRSPSQAQASLPLLNLATNLLDALDFSLVKPSSTSLTKIRRARSEFEIERQKEREKGKKEEEEEARLKKKREVEALKMEGLSEKEQAKRKELEEKRARRKQQGKMKAKA